VNDRAFRSLSLLQNSGATSRVLNLHRLQNQYGADAEHRANPFFKDQQLNRAIIVKHRLREAERELFEDYRASATKVILPIDGQDLRSGGRYVFIGQRGYEAILNDLLGEGLKRMEDRKTLEVLGRIPSFDPFLLREQLRRFDLAPAPSYFDISPGDLKRMFAFIQAELRALVGMSVTTADSRIGASTATLVQKILSNTAVDDMEPLRLVLRLKPEQYVEGVFCWKGFLYYKWRLVELTASVPELIRQIRGATPMGRGDADTKTYIAEAKARIGEAIMANCRSVADLLRIYDEAYERLTQAGEPAAFRDFLLQAPHMFVQLGEQLGVIDHIAGFWAHRFPPGRRAAASGEELMDILVDFEDSLGMNERTDRTKVLLAS
jgi:hypothetical protein